VLIDGEGRVRVVDFGLARADGGSGMFARPDTYADAIKSMSGSSMLDMRITRTGGMTGTPAYMAPEQYLGQPTDGRTDQFSFCVALFEGLYGLRPFIGERVAIVREAVLGGQIQDVPKDSDVPLWLRKILIHGLAVLPGERFRGMDDLLARLADDPRPPAKRWLAIAGACGLAGLVALAARELVREPPVAPSPVVALCDADAALADSWSATRSQAVLAAFSRSQVPAAEPIARRVIGVLDAHVQRWREQLAATCAPIKDEAGRVAAEPQVACLGRQLAGLQELSAALIRAEPRTVQMALQAAWALPPPRDCAGLGAEASPPGTRAATEPSLAGQDPRLELERAAVRGSLGDFAGALAQTRQVVDAANRSHDLRLQAEALHRQASLERSAGDVAAAERSLRGAMGAAEASLDDELQIACLTLLLEVLGERGHDEDAAALWPRLSTLLLHHNDDGGAESKALYAFGRLLLRRRRNAEAATQLALALRLGERSLDSAHPQVGAMLLDLATAQARLGAFEEAATQLDRAEKLLRDALPATDPALMPVYLTRAEAQRRRGRLGEAAADYERAEAILATMPGEELAARASVQLGQAQVALAQERLAAAQAGFGRALALLERESGNSAEALVEPLIGLCATASASGQHDAAIVLCKRALETAERQSNETEVGPAEMAMARAMWAQATATGAMTPTLREEILGFARRGLAGLQHAAHPDPNAIAVAATWIAQHESTAPAAP
jgi:serine/threonine-protein kinase